jgi:hypothetical protein
MQVIYSQISSKKDYFFVPESIGFDYESKEFMISVDFHNKQQFMISTFGNKKNKIVYLSLPGNEFFLSGSSSQEH